MEKFQKRLDGLINNHIPLKLDSNLLRKLIKEERKQELKHLLSLHLEVVKEDANLLDLLLQEKIQGSEMLVKIETRDLGERLVS